GLPHFEMQITLMNAHVIAAIAGPKENWPAAGDQLFVDLDLSEQALPIGTRLRIGEAEIEITQQEHTGCAKFGDRYGVDALRWVNSKERHASRLRGVNARVIQGGEIQLGDLLCKAE
ncbi:MAG: MOSC domain-containing protein, partial [Litorivicinus sp.]